LRAKNDRKAFIILMSITIRLDHQFDPSYWARSSDWDSVEAAVPELRLKNPLTIARSVRSVHLNLWDEAAKRLIAFRELRSRGVILTQ
jgi:fatty acid desaturase